MQSLNSCFGSISYPAEVSEVTMKLCLEIYGPSLSLSFIMTLVKMIPEKVLLKSLLGQQSTSGLNFMCL